MMLKVEAKDEMRQRCGDKETRVVTFIFNQFKLKSFSSHPPCIVSYIKGLSKVLVVGLASTGTLEPDVFRYTISFGYTRKRFDLTEEIEYVWGGQSTYGKMGVSNLKNKYST